MTFDERVAALGPLGFNAVQTRFLVTVALHSGFCLRRHYTAFAGLQYGEGVRDFLERLVAKKLARRFTFRRDRGHVYHLHHSGVYAAIGQDDNRNRRRTSPALIARKLMLLDFVLGRPGVEWFATEADKVALFTTRFGVPAPDLPQRIYVPRLRRGPATVRHFIHKQPIGLVGAVVELAYLVTDTTGHGLEQFLTDHVRLLNHLPRWRVVAIRMPRLPVTPSAPNTLRQVARGVQSPRSPEEIAELTFYFNALDKLERNEMEGVTRDYAARFQAARRRFAAPEHELLFQRWKIDGPAAIREPRGTGFLRALDEGRGAIVPHVLPFRYDRFGSRPGIV